MLLNVKQSDSLKRKVQRLDDLLESPLPTCSPVANASRERIHATVIAQRKRLVFFVAVYNFKFLYH